MHIIQQQQQQGCCHTWLTPSTCLGITPFHIVSLLIALYL